MDHRALAALLQLRRLRRRNTLSGFAKLDWPVNATTIIFSTNPYRIPSIRGHEAWEPSSIHPYALHQACSSRALDAVKHLLQMGLDPNFPDDSGRTPISMAMDTNDTESVGFLLEYGASIDISQPDHRAVVDAARLGNIRLFQLLLEYGAKTLREDGRLSSAFSSVVYSRSEETAKLFLENGVVASGEHLVQAAGNGDPKLVELIIKSGVHPDTFDNRNLTALCEASLRGRGDTVLLLLGQGAAINLIGGVYGTALQTACHFWRREIVMILLKGGADVNLCHPEIGSALHSAAGPGYTDLVEILLDHGAYVNVYSEFRGSALHSAAARGYTDVVKTLLDHGADVNIYRGEHCTALHSAAALDRTEVVKILLSHGADVNTYRGEHGTALHSAAALGGRSNHRQEKDSPLHSASFYGYSDCARLLLEAGADVNTKGFYGTPLETALVGKFRYTKGKGQWGAIIKLLFDWRATEPRADCHYGVRCKECFSEVEET